MALRKIAERLGRAWLLVGVTLGLFALIEGGLSLAFYVSDRMSWSFADRRYLADTYDHASWVLDYYKEYAATGLRWQPYVYWRAAPRRGQYVNVDDRGIRATPSSSSEPGAVKILMFGGSTMFGEGARDDFTIPSALARELAQKGIAAAITNFGQTGYVSNQERIALELALQQGQHPDLVIFYDGINDAASAWQQGVAGQPQNEMNRVREFNLSSERRWKDRAGSVLLEFALGLSSRRFVRHFLPHANPPARPVPASDQLPQQVVQVYLNNVEAIRLLADHDGFGALFYWQPTILGKLQLTDYEKSHRAQMTRMEALFRQIYDLVGQQTAQERDRVRDISSIFSDHTGPLFVDFFHLGERGNELVAKRMAQDVVIELSKRRSKRTS